MSSFDPSAHAGALAVPADLGTLLVTGKDRVAWLNGLVTCDLARLGPGDGAYGLTTSKVGRILADVFVVVAEDRLYVGVPRDRAASLRDVLDAYLVMEDAEIADASSDHAWVLVHGKGAVAAARASGEPWAPIDLTGLGGAAIVARAAGVSAAIDRSGATRGDDAAWDVLRLERAVPRFGVDFDEKTYPQEASLERRAVSFQKGCYLGQEVVCRLEMRGHVHRKLVAFVLDGDAPAPGASVAVGGDTVGAVTSAAVSGRLGRAVGLAMLKYAHANVGAKVDVGGRVAEIVAMPLGD